MRGEKINKCRCVNPEKTPATGNIEQNGTGRSTLKNFNHGKRINRAGRGIRTEGTRRQIEIGNNSCQEDLNRQERRRREWNLWSKLTSGKGKSASKGGEKRGRGDGTERSAGQRLGKKGDWDKRAASDSDRQDSPRFINRKSINDILQKKKRRKREIEGVKLDDGGEKRWKGQKLEEASGCGTQIYGLTGMSITYAEASQGGAKNFTGKTHEMGYRNYIIATTLTAGDIEEPKMNWSSTVHD